MDFADYLALEDSFGGLPGTGPNADFNASGTVDFADYLILEANFGHGNNSIPEPATMGLLGLSALLVLRRKRSR